MEDPGVNVGLNAAVNFGTVVVKSQPPDSDAVDASSSNQSINPHWPLISVQVPGYNSEGHVTPSLSVPKMEKQDAGYGDTITTNGSNINTTTTTDNTEAFTAYRQPRPEAYLPSTGDGFVIVHSDKDSTSAGSRDSRGHKQTRMESAVVVPTSVVETGTKTTSSDSLSEEEDVQVDDEPPSVTVEDESIISKKGSEDEEANKGDRPVVSPETDLPFKSVSGLSGGHSGGQDEIQVVEEGLEDFEEGELINYGQGRHGTSSETFLSQMRFFGGRTWARGRGRRRGRAREKDVTNIALKLIETDQLEADSVEEGDKEKSDETAFPTDNGKNSGIKSNASVPQRKSARITESKDKDIASVGIGRGITLRKETTRGRERTGGGRGCKTNRGGGQGKGRSLMTSTTDNAEEEAVDDAEYSNDEETLAAIRLSSAETEKPGRGRGLLTKRGGGQGKGRSRTASTTDNTEEGAVDDIEYESNDEETLAAIRLSLEEAEKPARGRGCKTKRGGGRGKGRSQVISATGNTEEKAVDGDVEYESNDEDTLAAIRLSLEEMNKNSTTSVEDNIEKDDIANKDDDIEKDVSAKKDNNGNMKVVDSFKNVDQTQKSDITKKANSEIGSSEIVNSPKIDNNKQCDDMIQGQTEIKGSKPKTQNRRKKGRKRPPVKPKPAKEIAAASLPEGEEEAVEYESNDEDTQAAIKASLEELEKEKQRQMGRDLGNQQAADKEMEKNLENWNTVGKEIETNLENEKTVMKQMERNLENKKTAEKTKKGKLLKRKHPAATKPTTTDGDVPESDEQNSWDSAAANDSGFQSDKRLRVTRKRGRQSPRLQKLPVYPPQADSSLGSLSAEIQEERSGLPDINTANQTIQRVESMGMKLRTRIHDPVNYAENERDGSSDISDFDNVAGTFLEVQDSPNAISISSNASNREEHEMSPLENNIQKESSILDVSIESDDDVIEQNPPPSPKSSTYDTLQPDAVTTHLRIQKLKPVHESSASQSSSRSVTPVLRKRAHNVTEDEEHQDDPFKSKVARTSLSNRSSGSSKHADSSTVDRSKATRKPQSDHQSGPSRFLNSDSFITDMTPLLSSTGLGATDAGEESLTKSVGGMMSYLFGDKLSEECPNGFVVNVRLEVEKKKNEDNGSNSNSSGTCCKTKKPELCPCLQKVSDEKLAAVLKERVEKRRDLTIRAKGTLLASILNFMQELETTSSSS